MLPYWNHETHAKLIAELQGQTVHVPDMMAYLANWPSCGRNKYYKRLKARLDKIVERLVARDAP